MKHQQVSEFPERSDGSKATGKAEAGTQTGVHERHTYQLSGAPELSASLASSPCSGSCIFVLPGCHAAVKVDIGNEAKDAPEATNTRKGHFPKMQKCKAPSEQPENAHKRAMRKARGQPRIIGAEFSVVFLFREWLPRRGWVRRLRAADQEKVPYNTKSLSFIVTR